MFCANCGAPVPEGHKYCEKCGAPISPETVNIGTSADGIGTGYNAPGAGTNSVNAPIYTSAAPVKKSSNFIWMSAIDKYFGIK